MSKFYHFWDDRKHGLSRHYIAKVEEIISIKDASSYIIENKEFGQSRFEKDKYSLLECWVAEKTHCDWLFAKKTDFFIKCSIPKYDKDPIYFARTINEGWFSINTTGWWQGGELDVDGSIFEEVLEYSSDELKEQHKSIEY